MNLVNCFHLVNMLYLSMFTFCRDLGAFAGNLSEWVFWVFCKSISLSFLVLET